MHWCLLQCCPDDLSCSEVFLEDLFGFLSEGLEVFLYFDLDELVLDLF